MSRAWRDKKLIAVLVLPGLIFFTGALAYPILHTVYLSFTQWNVLSPPKWVGLQNYITLVTADPQFDRSLLNTAILAGGSIVLQIPVAFLLAYWLARRVKRGARVLRAIYFFPVVVSGTAVGLVWQLMLQPQIGIVDAVFRAVGFHHFNVEWIGNPQLAIWTVVVSISWQYFGYHMLIQGAGMAAISTEVLDAAMMDGASERQELRHIVLPLQRRFLAVSFIIITASSVTIFANVAALTNGGPVYASQVLALHMYNEGFFYQNYGYASAIAVALTIVNVMAMLILGLVFYGRGRRVKRRQSLERGSGTAELLRPEALTVL